MNPTEAQQMDTNRVQRGIAKRFVQVILTVGVQAAVLFLAAGRLTWWPAWAYVGLYLAGIAINAIFLLRLMPETVAERAEAGEDWKDWDKVVGGLWAVTYFIVMLLVAGLDARFGWTAEVALVVHITGAVVFALGFALFSWAMVSNAYFSTVVRIQKERGHAVCTAGPYQYVRHPGYAGAILQSLAAPLLLGSLWALLPGVLAAVLMAVRTALEDRTLHDELDGYAAYAREVGYQLVPGVW